MPHKAEYKVLSGTTKDVEREIVVHGHKDWKPILMSTTQGTKGVVMTVIIELVLGA